MKVANKLILCAGALASVDAAKLRAQSRAQAAAEEGITVQTESGVEALSQSFLEAEAQSEIKMIAYREAQLNEENKTREQEKNKLLNLVQDSKAGEKANQQILENQDKRLMSTVNNINSSISQADRLINSLQAKAKSEKLINATDATTPPVAKDLL
jgi:hypothetical protein